MSSFSNNFQWWSTVFGIVINSQIKHIRYVSIQLLILKSFHVWPVEAFSDRFFSPSDITLVVFESFLTIWNDKIFQVYPVHFFPPRLRISHFLQGALIFLNGEYFKTIIPACTKTPPISVVLGGGYWNMQPSSVNPTRLVFKGEELPSPGQMVSLR